MADRVVFTSGSADRIAKVVRIVEAGNRDASALPTSPRFGGGGGGAALKLCTFTGSWAINTAKTLTFKNQTATPNTVLATNLYLSLDPSTACDVLIGKAGTAWYLVQVDLTKQPNYSGSGTNVFSVANGDMEWVPVATCEEPAASAAALSFFYR